jgi:hypothetical protein
VDWPIVEQQDTPAGAVNQERNDDSHGRRMYGTGSPEPDAVLIVIGHPPVRIQSSAKGKSERLRRIDSPCSNCSKMRVPGASHGAWTRQMSAANGLNFPRNFVQGRAKVGQVIGQ